MINSGGWLLLSVLFGFLMMLVQRAERNRRVVTLIVLFFVASLVYNYGIYRINTGCDQVLEIMCKFVAVRQRTDVIARNTVNMAVLAAFIFNFLFWFTIGRYNPPRSSDAIKVLGLND